MKTKILMIYPEIPSTYWSMKYCLPFIRKKASFPPLGLLTVAAMLPDHYEVKLVDMNASVLLDKDIQDADLIFLSAMIIQKESFAEVVTRCQTFGKTIVAGGPYPSSSHHQITGVDHFVLNEAEITLPEFLADYESGDLKPLYTSEEKPDITKIPPPRYDLLPHLNDYVSLALQYSRGCPFDCEFCDIIEMFGRRTRTKTPEQFLHEMELLYQQGHRGTLFIVDDNFIGNKKNVKELIPRIIDWQKAHHFPFYLFTEASINLADDEELMDMMVQAGFNMVFLGIETPVEASLLETNKRQNTKVDMLESIHKIQNKGIEVSGGFILGFDGDPDNVFDLQLDFIQKSGIPMAMVGLLLALPNTQLYRRLKKENRLVETKTIGNNTHSLELNYIPKMNPLTLISGYKKLIATLYHPKYYFKRCMVLLRNHPKKPQVISAMSLSFILNNIYGFFYSLVRQTFSSYGWSYLKFLGRSLLYSPMLFPKAVRMAVRGHHFIQITKEILEVERFKKRLDHMLISIKEKAESYRLSANASESVVKLRQFVAKKKIEALKEYHRLHKDYQKNVQDYLKRYEEFAESMMMEWENKAHKRFRGSTAL